MFLNAASLLLFNVADTCPGQLGGMQRRASGQLGRRMCCIIILLAKEAIALQRSADDVLKNVQSLFQAAASNPEGPAAPSILTAVLLIS